MQENSKDILKLTVLSLEGQKESQVDLKLLREKREGAILLDRKLRRKDKVSNDTNVKVLEM